MRRGLVYLFTGDGKGKTSAAIGVGVRAALSGMKVAMVCWYKSRDWDVSEYRLPKNLPNFGVFPMGVGFHIKSSKFPTSLKLRGAGKVQSAKLKRAPIRGGGVVIDDKTFGEHREAAGEALAKARQLVGRVDVLILDEVNAAVKDRLIDLSALIDLISKRGKAHLILTGRHAHPKIVKLADLVTEMRKIKHPYDLGRKAVKGLDF